YWAASNGDRSENGDYIYGKKRLREIDRRIRFLSKRLEHAVVVDPATREDTDQVFFGATVTVADQDGSESTYAIVGTDETDPGRGHIAWISPMARALLKAREGDTVSVQTPDGRREVEIVAVRYVALDEGSGP
ncbi:MAG: transcription elongation factor GreB, partial [Hydrogenophilales bacterium 17-62-8]